MAFQSGSRIDPRLLDYSGYAQGMSNAAAIQAKSMIELGEQVGGVIQGFQKNRQVKKLDDAFLRKLENNPKIAMTVLGESYTDEVGKAFVKDMREGLGEETYTTVVGQVLFGDLLKEKKDPKEISAKSVQGVFDFIDTNDQYDIEKIDGKNQVVRVMDGERYIVKPGDEIYGLEGASEAISMISGDPMSLYGNSVSKLESPRKVTIPVTETDDREISAETGAIPVRGFPTGGLGGSIPTGMGI